MKNRQLASLAVPESEDEQAIARATLVSVTSDGRAIVAVSGVEDTFEVSTTIGFGSREEAEQVIGGEVIVLRSEQGLRGGVIIGFVRDCLWGHLEVSESGQSESGTIETRIDGKRIELEGQQEIILKCGKSKIHLKKDGTLVMQGVRITSRARSTHKIKGASVNIN